jgi:chromosome segregation ATPase
MSRIELLNKLLGDMDASLNQLNRSIHDKEENIKQISSHLHDLQVSLEREQVSLDELNKNRSDLIELQTETKSNYKQIEDGVNTLLEILQSRSKL